MSKVEKSWIHESRLWMITDEYAARGRPLAGLVSAGIEGGVDVVVVRLKETEPGELAIQAKKIAEVCRIAGIPWVLSHNVEHTSKLKPDSVHIGAADRPVSEVRAIIGEDVALGYSAHSKGEIVRAASEGADYCWLSPLLSTRKQGTTLPGKGVDEMVSILKAAEEIGTPRHPYPVVFLGGITPKNVGVLVTLGARRFAAIGAIIGADDVRGAARAFKRAILSSG